MFSQQFPGTQGAPLATPASKSTTQTQTQQNQSQTQLQSKSTAPNQRPAPSATPSSTHQTINASMSNMQAQFMPPPMPYMDPAAYASYMYYQMANPYAFPAMNPFANPYAMSAQGPYGLSMMSSASLAGGQRQLQEDQQSMRSYNFDLDTRSEKKLNMNRAASVVGGFKSEVDPKRSLFQQQSQPQQQQQSRQTDLLMEASNQNQEIMGIVEDKVNVLPENLIKREEHRMTPQLHQLPHVRATFALNSIVQIRANDPCEGQPALVDIINLTEFTEQYTNNLRSSKINDSLNEDDDNDEMKSEIL